MKPTTKTPAKKAPAKAPAKKPVPVMKTTRTADGGQQYVRDNDYKVATGVADRVSIGNRGTTNPKAARMARETAYYALDPKDRGLARDMGKIYDKLAKDKNASIRDRGDKTRR